MRFGRSFVLGLLLAGLFSLAPVHGYANDVKMEGTRFTMSIPSGWVPGYRDLDNLFMIYFKDPKSGAVLEGVYLRGSPPAGFSLADFKKARIESEDKRYAGKGHTVLKDGPIDISGAKGNYLLTGWKDGGKDFEKHTAQHLGNGGRYLVVMSGEKGKVDKKVFDKAVHTFALTK